MSYLGAALLGQGRYSEAEPLLLDGRNGLWAGKATLPKTAVRFLTEADARVVRLYEAWGKPDLARAWKAKRGPADLPDDVFAPP